MTIGKKIKDYRKKLKLTQLELSERAKMSRSYLADIEADRYNPSVETLKTVAEALNIQVHMLLEEEAHEENMAFYGGGKDWTKEELRVAEAAIEAYRKLKKEEG